MGKTKEQIEITAKDRTKAALQQAENGFLSLDKGISTALKGAAAFAGVTALGAVITKSLEAADAIGKTAKAAGVGTTFLQEMRFAAEQSGVATNQLDDGMRRLTRRIGLAADGGGPAIKAFENMGIAVRDVNGNVRSTEDIFKDLTSGMGDVESAAEKAALASAFFGDDAGPKLALLLAEGSTGIAVLSERAQELGLVLSEEMVAGSEAAGDKISQLEQILSIKMVKTVAENAEAIGKFADAIISFVGVTAKALEKASEFFDYLNEAGKDLGENLALALSDSELAKVRQLEKSLEGINHRIKVGGGAGEGYLNYWRKRGEQVEKQLDKIKSKYESVYGYKADTSSLDGSAATAAESSTTAPTADVVKAVKKQSVAFSQPANADIFDATAEKEAARAEARIAAIELQMASEEERLSTSYINRETIVETAFENGYIEEERRNAIIQDLEQKHNDELARIQEESLSTQELLWKTSFQGRMQVMQGVLGQVSNLMQTENKKQFELGKKAAIAQTVINTYQAAVGAYSALASIPFVGPFLGAAAATAAALYGKAQVSRINTQQFGGGGVGGGSAPTGTFSANPNTSEPTDSPGGGQTNITNINSGKSTPSRVENYIIKGEVFSREAVRDLIDKQNQARDDGVEMNVSFA